VGWPLLALVLFVLVFCPQRNLLAGTKTGTEPRDSTSSGGLAAWAAHKISWFGWMRGGGGGTQPKTAACTDLERDCKMLEPFYGCKIDTIVVSGNTHTKTIAILREMATKQGDYLDEKLIRRDSAYLRGLGYFAEVAISAEQTEYGNCRIFVTVVDRPGLFMQVPYPVLNYDFENGLSYGATWRIKNFRGLEEDISASALTRRNREDGGSFTWNIPWFRGRRLNLRFDAFAYRRIDSPADTTEDYMKRQNAVALGFGVPLSRSLVKQFWLRPSFSFDVRESRLTLLDSRGGYRTGLYYQDFISAGAQLEYDSRANRISPFNGMLHRVSVQRFMSVSGPNQQYVFYAFSNYFYVPTGAERALIFALRGDVREGDLPSFYEMALGGLRDVRGFSDQDLRGSTKLIGTIQYRSQIFGPHVFGLPKIGKFDLTVNGVAFVDNGALMNSILDVGKTTFHTTAGLGFEVISPFRDLLRLEVASDGTGRPAFYMTSGANF
jgi:outer membrane protein assembly factor BamA